MIPHDTIRGRIHYTSSKPDRKNAERGREHFTITKHTDGRRTLRAHAEIDDEPNVLRDVTLSMDKDWNTTDAFVRLSVGDEMMGSSWFLFEDNFAECEGYLKDKGRISERVEYDKRPDLFGAHPIQGDAWLFSSVDISNGPCVKICDRLLGSSLDHRGATGPSLVWHEPGMLFEYIGKEKITVGAGTFEALHFCIGDRNIEVEGSNESGVHPVYEVWTTADGDFIFLKAFVSGYMMTQYELVELERIPHR
jgi:hypothetical protein